MDQFQKTFNEFAASMRDVDSEIDDALSLALYAFLGGNTGRT